MPTRDRLRIAVWVKVFPPHYESFILGQIRDLVQRGYDVTIMAAKRGTGPTLVGTADDDGLWRRVVYRPAIPSRRLVRGLHAAFLGAGGLWYQPRQTLNWLRSVGAGESVTSSRALHEAEPFWRQGPFDIIHCQYGPLGVIAAELKRRGMLTGEIVTSFRGYDLSRVVQQSPDVYRQLFRIGSRFLPVCEAFARRLQSLGCPADRITVLRSGIDVGEFAFCPRTLTPGQPVRLVSVGRLVEKKGFADGLRAVALLIRQGHAVRYNIVGEGPLRQELAALAGQLGIASHVELRGWLPPPLVRTELDRAHLMLAPSVTAAEGSEEGIPNTAKEAMACGLPVVASRHSGIPELVQDGITGYLVPERDPEALAERVVRLILTPARWPEMGRAGRQFVEEHYDSHRVHDGLARVYREVSGGADRDSQVAGERASEAE